MTSGSPRSHRPSGSELPEATPRDRELAALGVHPCTFLDEERARRRPQPKRLAEFVGSLMRDRRPAQVTVQGTSPSRPDRVLESLEETWRETVGDAIAEVTRVTRYRGGVLTVMVNATAVRTELEFARVHLIAALAEQGLRGVHSIRFVNRSSRSPRGGGAERTEG